MTADIKHIAIVEGRTDRALALNMSVNSSCGTCGARTLCAMGDTQQRRLTVEVPDASIYEVGEAVELSISRAMGVKAVFLAYVIPFLIGFSLLFILLQSGCSDVIAGLSSLGSLAFYYLILYIRRGHMEQGILFTVNKIH